MSGTGQNNFQAPDRLTPPSGDQPIGTDAEGRPVSMTMWMYQFLQRLMSYLGQPSAGNKPGQTISQQVGTLNEEMGLALSGPGSAVPGIEGRLARTEAMLARLANALPPAVSRTSDWQMPHPVASRVSDWRIPSPVALMPSAVVIPGPPVEWNAGFVSAVGSGLSLSASGVLTASAGSPVWAPLVNGDLPGPTLIANGAGECIMVPVT